MRKFTRIASVLAALVWITPGCRSDGAADAGPQPASAKPSSSDSKSKPPSPDMRTDASPGRRGRLATAGPGNPTTKAGRGDPSLDDAERPAVWVTVDGNEGAFAERDGQKQLQWVISKPVGASPTFAVEVYEPLLGRPTDLKYIIKTVESPDGLDLAYAVSAQSGVFVAGQEYSLLHPGDGFVVRNWHTGDVVREIAPLPPGTYLIAAKVANGSGKEAAGVTYFTVGDGG